MCIKRIEVAVLILESTNYNLHLSCKKLYQKEHWWICVAMSQRQHSWYLVRKVTAA